MKNWQNDFFWYYTSKKGGLLINIERFNNDFIKLIKKDRFDLELFKAIIEEILKPRKAYDENHNPLNEDTAVYLTSSWIIASAYSFGKNEKYSGSFETDRIDGNPYVFFENDNLDEEEIGYIYVFEKNSDKFIHNGGRSLQYRCHEKITLLIWSFQIEKSFFTNVQKMKNCLSLFHLTFFVFLCGSVFCCHCSSFCSCFYAHVLFCFVFDKR